MTSRSNTPPKCLLDFARMVHPELQKVRPEDAEEWLDKNYPTWRNPCNHSYSRPALFLHVMLGRCYLWTDWDAEGDKYVKNPYRSPW